MPEERVVKVPMSVELIRRMDRALSKRRGGFTTRAEFISEAVDQLLVEVSYADAPPEPLLVAPSVDRAATGSSARDETTGPAAQGHRQAVLPLMTEPSESPLFLRSLEETELRLDSSSALVDGGIGRASDGPLLGLHNRDYPSIWAAHRLAAYTHEDLISWRRYLERVTDEAWQFAASLDALERRGHGHGRRLRALFPANQEKRQSSERGFQAFGVGTVSRRADGQQLPVSGPLFTWQICQVVAPIDDPRIGLTRHGWELLEALDGISLVTPHERRHALAFFDHLRRHAPADWRGFEELLATLRVRSDRNSLVEAFASSEFFAETMPRRTEAMISSLVQGYVGRAREWGLLERKQTDGQYQLTDFGREQTELAN